MTQLTYTETLTVVVCTCGINYAIPEALERQLQQHPSGSSDRKSVYCPLGHQWHYLGKSPEQKLREAEQRTQATRDLLHAEERSHAATRGHLTRVRKRVHHGVCPHCQRSFQDLRRHMRSKHRDEIKADG